VRASPRLKPAPVERDPRCQRAIDGPHGEMDRREEQHGPQRDHTAKRNAPANDKGRPHRRMAGRTRHLVRGAIVLLERPDRIAAKLWIGVGGAVLLGFSALIG
jgi:hypothetical protein